MGNASYVGISKKRTVVFLHSPFLPAALAWVKMWTANKAFSHICSKSQLTSKIAGGWRCLKNPVFVLSLACEPRTSLCFAMSLPPIHPGTSILSCKKLGGNTTCYANALTIPHLLLQSIFQGHKLILYNPSIWCMATAKRQPQKLRSSALYELVCVHAARSIATGLEKPDMQKHIKTKTNSCFMPRKCSWCCLRCPVGMNSNMLNMCQMTATANFSRYWKNLNLCDTFSLAVWRNGDAESALRSYQIAYEISFLKRLSSLPIGFRITSKKSIVAAAAALRSLGFSGSVFISLMSVSSSKPSFTCKKCTLRRNRPLKPFSN